MLEPYVDGPKGFKLYAPSGWNKFDADPGVYDVKFQDIIESETIVQVSTSPVQTAFPSTMSPTPIGRFYGTTLCRRRAKLLPIAPRTASPRCKSRLCPLAMCRRTAMRQLYFPRALLSV